jgi:3-oxoacyl-[acyl-carrier-protein] synthase II
VTATLTAVEPLVVTSTGVVSPAGLGLAGLGGPPAPDRSDRPQGRPGDEDYPPIPLAAVDGLDPEQYLGRKGVRHLDWTTKLALVACSRALDGLDVAADGGHDARTGVVIGTSTGSIRSSSEFSKETLVQEKPYLVRANLFPNSVMNCCAGQIAIRNRLHGVNATIAGGRLSMFNAVRYTRNAILGGHIDRALVGGVEELSAQSAWGWYLSGALTSHSAVGEGCAVFLAERASAAAQAGREPLAELLACEVASAGAERQPTVTQRLTEVIGRALERSGVRPEEVATVSWGCTGLVGLERAERRAVTAALGGRLPEHLISVAETVGESFSASGALQLAAVLANPGDGGVALVTSIGPDGATGCLVVRPAPR